MRWLSTTLGSYVRVAVVFCDGYLILPQYLHHFARFLHASGLAADLLFLPVVFHTGGAFARIREVIRGETCFILEEGLECECGALGFDFDFLDCVGSCRHCVDDFPHKPAVALAATLPVHLVAAGEHLARAIQVVHARYLLADGFGPQSAPRPIPRQLRDIHTSDATAECNDSKSANTMHAADCAQLRGVFGRLSQYISLALAYKNSCKMSGKIIDL